MDGDIKELHVNVKHADGIDGAHMSRIQQQITSVVQTHVSAFLVACIIFSIAMKRHFKMIKNGWQCSNNKFIFMTVLKKLGNHTDH